VNKQLSASQIESFQRDGYLIFRNWVAPAACEAMLTVTRQHLSAAVPPLELETDVGYPGAPQSVDAVGGRTIRRLRGAYQRDAVYRQWAQDPTLVSRLTQLFNEEICLSLAHHNCIMTKHPQFGTATGWHRDIRYWSFTRPDLISVWLALGEENESNGGLKVIPGSHRAAIAPAQLDELDFLRPDAKENQSLFAQGTPLVLHQGDVVFFHSGLFHAAGRNESRDIKSSVVFVYHGKSNQSVAGSKSALQGEVNLWQGDNV
jgi:phytanoyl-CoA hydroxylase